MPKTQRRRVYGEKHTAPLSLDELTEAGIDELIFTSDHPERLRVQLAEAVRDACIEEALHRYKDARIRGLCAEGAWEAAVGALRTLDLETVLHDATGKTPPENQ